MGGVPEYPRTHAEIQIALIVSWARPCSCCHWQLNASIIRLEGILIGLSLVQDFAGVNKRGTLLTWSGDILNGVVICLLTFSLC